MTLKRIGIVLIVIGFLTQMLMLYILLDVSADGGRLLSPIPHIFTTIFALVLFYLGIAFQFLNKPKKRRRKVAFILFAIAAFLIVDGFILRYLELPSAMVQVIHGVFLLCFAYGPVSVVNRFEKWREYTSSNFQTLSLSLADLLSMILLSTGALFKIQQWPGAGVMMYSGAVLLAIAIFLWNRVFRSVVVKQKETQEQLNEAYEEIVDSISYAKRIQQAILPPPRIVKTYLKNSFILYKPKDIVAGDFYWMEGSENTVLFAAADCTGHGVPGAMVSVVCNNAMNRSVREFGLTEPGEILDKAREIVVQEFEKSDEDVKDGMDIALCSLNGLTLKYAGAHNPLWLIRKGELIETKGDKQPIGKFDHGSEFKTHSIQLEKGDTFYLFSDGFADQFGGEKGKKFKAANFKKLLLSIQDQSMEEQQNSIDSAFENWRGSLEQLDDVCVIGVRV